jgi:endonuclease/exonuclease/phosphatase family metal-dependent hydrolase
MSRCVNTGVRTFGIILLAAAALAGAPSRALAQTTVVLDAPDSESVDTVVRGGRYASTNYDKKPLITRASSNRDYMRHVLLKFDTDSRVPDKATITSAKLTLTVQGGGSSSRRLAAYRISDSFDERTATWQLRKRGTRWDKAGGDFGGKYAEATVGGKGSRVTFDVTKLVQEVVNGKHGSSHWTRIAVFDPGATLRDSYREYYPSESRDASKRPTLTVVYQKGSSSAPKDDDPKDREPRDPTPTPKPTPPPPPPPDDEDDDNDDGDDNGSGSSLRVLHWNLYHGQDAKKKWAFSRQMEVIAKAKPDLISLNEVEKYNSSYGNIDQAAELAKYLTEETGKKWYHYMRVGTGSSRGIGNAVLSRFPLVSTSYCQLSGKRNAVHLGVVVNGRSINLWSTHLAVESGSYRVDEAETLLSCMDNFSEQRLVAGDFNSQSGAKEIRMMTDDHTDIWSKAKSLSAAKNYSGNCDGCTRNSRIDYMFLSKGASRLTLKSAQIIDTRNSSGTMASDHKPMLVVYSVK